MRQSGRELTVHHGLPRRWFGYTALDWFKFYGFVAGFVFLLAYTYIKYLGMFEDIQSQPAAYQNFVLWFAGLPLLLALSALLGFVWWAAGGLVRYSRWQAAQPLLWRVFWVAVLLFYGYVLIDPLDRIHPMMSRNGLAMVPDFVQFFDGKFEWRQFQLGYFTLYSLFYFLLAALHYSYVRDGLREFWFYVNRTQRYGASVLTGFHETLKVMRDPPLSYPLERGKARYGAPRLNPARAGGWLTRAEAEALAQSDRAALTLHDGLQGWSLVADLALWQPGSPALGVTDSDGAPLLLGDGPLPGGATTRAELLFELAGGRGQAAADGAAEARS